MPHFALFCSPPAPSLHALQLTTPPCKGGGRVTSLMLPCCYHATATSHSPDRSAPSSWRQRNVQIWFSFYQIRCSPFFRDLGMEEKREGCVFWNLVSSLEHIYIYTFSCVYIYTYIYTWWHLLSRVQYNCVVGQFCNVNVFLLIVNSAFGPECLIKPILCFPQGLWAYHING